MWHILVEIMKSPIINLDVHDADILLGVAQQSHYWCSIPTHLEVLFVWADTLLNISLL